MILSQIKGKLVSQLIIGLILFLIADTYYLHITNNKPSLGIVDKNFVFAMTSCFGISFLVALVNFSHNYHSDKAREKFANHLGWISISSSFGALFIFGVIAQKMPPVWLCDLLVQITLIAGIAGISILPKKSDHRLMVSVIFAIIVGILYFMYRF